MLSFKTVQEFDDWLLTNYDKQTELWVRMYKKSTGIQSIDWSELVVVCLKYGWIDSQRKSYDDESWGQRITPRKSNLWSDRNISIMEQMIHNGEAHANGIHCFKFKKRRG